MSRPALLLLDEPSLGLAPIVVKQIFTILRELTARLGSSSSSSAGRLISARAIASICCSPPESVIARCRELTAQGMTLFLVEQNARHALKLANRGYVMVNGEIRLSICLTTIGARPRLGSSSSSSAGRLISARAIASICCSIFADMTVEENLQMGTIAIGNRYQKEDLARMYSLMAMVPICKFSSTVMSAKIRRPSGA
jgi:ABC-type branched-subunit amino acid transport system ATPase component